jgi:hypothetical protein
MHERLAATSIAREIDLKCDFELIAVHLRRQRATKGMDGGVLLP